MTQHVHIITNLRELQTNQAEYLRTDIITEWCLQLRQTNQRSEFSEKRTKLKSKDILQEIPYNYKIISFTYRATGVFILQEKKPYVRCGATLGIDMRIGISGKSPGGLGSNDTYDTWFQAGLQTGSVKSKLLCFCFDSEMQYAGGYTRWFPLFCVCFHFSLTGKVLLSVELVSFLATMRTTYGWHSKL